MLRLSGLDATFLYMETPTSYMHVAGLAVFDPSDVPGGFSVEAVKDVYASRLHLAAPFRRRLVEVPLGLHHPLWIEDPDFDLDWHIRHIAVPAPGTLEQLCELAAHLVSIQLDRTRPLWEMWLIEGLENGYVAALSKVHHAAIDGVSGNEITVAVLDVTPEPRQVDPPTTPWQPDRVPSDIEMLGYAMSSLARQPLAAAKATRRTAEGMVALRRRARQPDIEPPAGGGRAPRTSFNSALTPHRSFAATSVSLDDVKFVKNAFGATVNDVVLAICGGALRRYFDSRDEHPDGPLVAMVPVSVRADTEKGDLGNRVSQMGVSLATDIDDPVERLHNIHEHTQYAKGNLQAIGADTLSNWVEFAAPALLGRAARLYSRTKMADRHRPLFNVTISNVPGPAFPLYSAGARMVANYPMGPIFDGGGLNMTVMSYMDHLDFGLVACSDLIPDVWVISQGLEDSLEELKKAAERVNAAPGAAKPSEADPPSKAGKAKTS
jgi:WS/DGAT/MGAT family acyltransferase